MLNAYTNALHLLLFEVLKLGWVQLWRRKPGPRGPPPAATAAAMAMRLRCPNCGKELLKDYRYCPFCGKQLKNID